MFRHAAVSYGHLALIEVLLGAGANLNLRDADGDCPLHVCEDPLIAEFLMQNGADPSVVNDSGETVFDKAVEDENEAMITFWTEKGLNVSSGVRQEAEGEIEWTEEQNEDDCDDIEITT
jgi:ankyrin repeat protein